MKNEKYNQLFITKIKRTSIPHMNKYRGKLIIKANKKLIGMVEK